MMWLQFFLMRPHLRAARADKQFQFLLPCCCRVFIPDVAKLGKMFDVKFACLGNCHCNNGFKTSPCSNLFLLSLAIFCAEHIYPQRELKSKNPGFRKVVSLSTMGITRTKRKTLPIFRTLSLKIPFIQNTVNGQING